MPEEEIPTDYPWDITTSMPPRFVPHRYGLVFQAHPLTPGTLAQQATLRQGVEDFGTGQTGTRARMLWFFAGAYKRRQQELWGGGEGALHHVNVSIEGAQGYAFANSMVLPTWAFGSDLWLTFCHEWGHLFDRYTMNPDMRLALMDSIAIDNQWAAEGNWQGSPAIEDYWQRPQEIFAFSFQRLCVPDLPELEWGFSRQLMLSVLPDWDQAWLDAGFEIRG